MEGLTELGKSDTSSIKERHLRSLCEEIRLCYETKNHCDLRLFTDDCSSVIECHSIVLASISPFLKCLLCEENKSDLVYTIHLPGVSYDALTRFVNNVYDHLASGEAGQIEIATTIELANIFCLGEKKFDEKAFLKSARIKFEDHDGPGVLLATPQIILKEEPNEAVDDESVLQEDNLFNDSEESLSDYVASERTKTKKRIRRKSWSDIDDDELEDEEPLAKKPRKQNGVRCQKPNDNRTCRYNTSVSHRLELTDDELRQAILTNTGTIQATTAKNFFTQTTRLGRKGTTSRISGFPESRFVAMLAVGVESETRNVATVLTTTDPHWPEQSTVDNLVEMALRYDDASTWEAVIRSTKYGEVYDKFESTRNQIESRLKKLNMTDEEKEDRIAKCQEKFKYWRRSVEPVAFEHLPMQSMLVEFELRPFIPPEQVLDFVLLSGDSFKSLKVRSYINLDVTKPINGPVNLMVCSMVMFLRLNIGSDLLQTSYLGKIIRDYYETKFELEFLEMKSLRPCPVCGQLLTFRLVHRHKKMHELEQKDCGCGIVFGTLIEKDYHWKTQHSEKKYFGCPTEGCHKTFSTKKSLDVHIIQFHDRSFQGEGFVCDICAQVFENDRRLFIHVYHKHKEFKCEKCGEVLIGKNAKKSHQVKFHPVMVKCSDCDMVFKRRAAYITHKRRIHNPETLKFRCEICSKGFLTKRDYDRHKMNVHIKSRPFKCSVYDCNADFNDDSNCRMHEKRVHGIDRRQAPQQQL